MAKTDFYTFNTDPQDPNHYICIAVDKDMDFVKQYDIHGSVCQCWAGNKWCRHKKMLVTFKSQGLLNSRKYYNYDTNKWIQAKEQEL